MKLKMAVASALAVAIVGSLGVSAGCSAAQTTVQSSSDAPNEIDGRAYSFHDGRHDRSPAPAVVILHGGRSDGDTARRYTDFDRWADAYGIVAIYPNAQGGEWNDGRGVSFSGREGNQPDDVAYLRRLIARLAREGLVDPSRVYFGGISNGGGMAIRMSCDAPTLVRGVGVVTTKIFRDFRCEAQSPVSAAFFFGTDDPVSPHEGRRTGFEGLGDMNKGRTFSAEETAAIWSRRNRCGAADTRQLPDRDPSDGTTVSFTRYDGCAEPLHVYTIDGGGHTWPGTMIRSQRIVALVGRTTQDIDANAQMMQLWFGEPRRPVTASNRDTGSAGASRPSSQEGGAARFQAMDTNQDQRISRAEWEAAGRRNFGFRRIDRNGDGFLSIEELRSFMQNRRQR